MTLNFPNSPTDGQIYEGYQWDATKGAWVAAGGTQILASTAVAGIVELATDAETQAGTDSTRAVTPAGLTASRDNLSARSVSEPPSSYPVGVSQFGVYSPSSSGWPTNFGTVLTVRADGNRCFQQFVNKTSSEVWVRSVGSSADTWGDWKRLLIEGEAGTVRAAATGTYASITDLASGSGVSISVTFPAGRFSTVPAVTLNPTVSGRIQCAALSITTSGFTARLDNFSGGTASDRDFNWIAIETW